VSAGAAMACAALLGRCEQTLALFMAATSRNPRNIYPANPLRGEPLFPHHRMYREAILGIVDQDGLRRLQTDTELRMVLARPPARLGPRLSLLVGLGCYLVERRRGDPVHSRLARRLGFEAEAVSVRRCRTPEELADLVLASSCTPPFTPALRWTGSPVLDGSLAQSVPVDALDGDEQRTLVLLSRRYGAPPPSRPDRVYVAPSEPAPVGKWDYTRPHLLQRTYDLGRRDAEAFLVSRERRLSGVVSSSSLA